MYTEVVGLKGLDAVLDLWFGRAREVLPRALGHMSGLLGEVGVEGVESLSHFSKACPT